MGAPAKTVKKSPKRTRQSRNGHKTLPKAKGKAKANGNGHKAARKRTNGKLDLRPPDPLARDLIAAVTSLNGNGNSAAPAEVKVSKPQARKVAVEFGGAMLEATNVETAKHSDDVVLIARAICEPLGIKGTERQDLLAAARLHDIGKAAVPLEVINKAGPLSEAEWGLMRQHTVIGDQILSSVPELQDIARMVRHSHERWDGNGYPDGLKGEEIPLGSRVIFCADAFHAIRSDRPYRTGRTAAQSLAEVKRNAGTQFDPTVVEAFEHVVRELKLAPPGSPLRRSSRLTAMLLMLAIGTSGSAVAASGILGEAAAASEPAPGSTAAASGTQMLGLSFDDAIEVQRSDGAFDAYAIGAGGLGLGAGHATGDSPGSQLNPGSDGAQRPDGTAGPTATDESGGAGETSSGSQGGSGNSSSHNSSSGNPGHPHGGPPGQTGSHPQGGPPGQTGNHPQGGPPGQTGSHPQGGPPGQSSKGTSGSSGASGGTSGSSSGTGGSSADSGTGPSGSGPPGQAKKPK
jgi:HD-GYP domain-containing protein (c-di-GMP phosphodiesterase class II)